MKRDIDLIRTIVLHVRDHGTQPDEVRGHSRKDLAYHCWLIFNGQLADGADASLGTDLAAKLYSLTWAGQNFADAVANESLWKEAMKAISRTTTSVSFDTLLHILAEMSVERVRLLRSR